MIKYNILMNFFFVQDFRQKYRYFSAEPLSVTQVEFSRWKEFWERAKKKLMLLPLKILKQELFQLNELIVTLS